MYEICSYVPNCFLGLFFSICRVLSDARSLGEIPSLEGCSALEILRMDRANITTIPNTLCRNSSHLKSLYVDLALICDPIDFCFVTVTFTYTNHCFCFVFTRSLPLHDLPMPTIFTISFYRELKSNKLKSIPELSYCKDLRIL